MWAGRIDEMPENTLGPFDVIILDLAPVDFNHAMPTEKVCSLEVRECGSCWSV